MNVLFYGSAIACCAGLLSGGILDRHGPAAPGAFDAEAASSGVQWAQPDALDPGPDANQPSPPLLVRMSGLWVTPDYRAAALAVQSPVPEALNPVETADASVLPAPQAPIALAMAADDINTDLVSAEQAAAPAPPETLTP